MPKTPSTPLQRRLRQALDWTTENVDTVLEIVIFAAAFLGALRTQSGVPRRPN